MTKKIVLGIVVLTILAGGIFWYLKFSGYDQPFSIEGKKDSSKLVPPALPD